MGRPKAFESWLAALNGVRNFSAHHARLWNRTLVAVASRPRTGEIAALDHLATLDDVARVKVYSPIAFLVWVLGTTPWGAEWKSQLIGHLESFPGLPQGSLANAGFPDGWRSLELWTR
jgi:abortive infection bacteriophage resistance protein